MSSGELAGACTPAQAHASVGECLLWGWGCTYVRTADAHGCTRGLATGRASLPYLAPSRVGLRRRLLG